MRSINKGNVLNNFINVNCKRRLSCYVIVSVTAVTALKQPSPAHTVRHLYRLATLNPALIAPSVRTMEGTTPVNAGLVKEALLLVK